MVFAAIFLMALLCSAEEFFYNILYLVIVALGFLIFIQFYH